jgi:uncharacterized DUF497 family protein
MEFDFDPGKSIANKTKHGIDFQMAQSLWDDEKRIEIPARTDPEERWMVIGRIRGKYWSAIYTLRAHRIRIISVRRARKDEVSLYES